MKNFTTLAGLCLALALLFSSSASHLRAQVVAKKVRTSTGQVVPFLQSKPTRHDVTGPNRKYPLIIFLHGGGALQSNDTSLTPVFPDSGYAPVWKLNGWGPIREVGWQNNNLRATWNNKTDSFCVLQPLSPAGITTWPISYIDAMIQYGTDSLKVDTNRIYLAGHSYGGAGVFNYLNSSGANAKKLAAAVPISAWNTGLYTNGVNYVSAAKLPVWGFHAYDDPTTSRDTTINSINRLNAVNPPVKPLLTIWPAGMVTPQPHNSAPEYVFAIHQYPFLEDGVINIYEWFLGQNNDSLPNISPIARAGNDTIILSSSGVANLKGSTSTDADGTIVRYVWRKISGPAGGTIATPFGTASSTTVSGLTTVGIYQYQLNVVDNRAAIARDTIKITVSNVVGKEVNTGAPNGRVYTNTDVTQLTNASQFTLEAQVMIDSTASDWTTIIRKGYNGTHRIMFHVGPGDNSIHCIIGNGTNTYGKTTANAITVGAWYHLAFVYDGTQTGNANRVKLYINGVQKTLNFDSTIIPATTSSLLAGQAFMAGSNLNEGHIDHIDEVRVWNTALPGNTISDWKNKLLDICHPNIASLVLYWPLNNSSISTFATAELGTAYSGYVTNASYINSNQAIASSDCGARIVQSSPLDAIKENKLPGGKLYPNPTDGLVQIELTGPVSTSVIVNVIDLSGRLLYSTQRPIVKGNNKISLNIASLPAGTYVIEIKDGKTIMEKYKVLKR